MVLNCTDLKWDEYVNKLPMNRQDIYFFRGHCQLGGMLEEGEALLFVYEEETNLGIYPFVKKEIKSDLFEETYFDITTPYGYGGPVFQKEDEEFKSRFEKAFLEYCASENVIAEFVRFHPLLKNENGFKKKMQVLHNRTTVWINLDQDIETIWMHEVATQNRNVIRKCEKNGLTVELSTDFEEFKNIYYETMNKVAAEDFYFFDDAYFDFMKNRDVYRILRVRREDETLAAAIFMGTGEYFHYHLAGSRREFLKYSPNNILLWEAMQYAKKNGFKKMFLGGGLTDSTEDNLFRFKKKFSSSVADFYIGKRVHNADIYNALIEDWERKNNKKAKMLLQYRY